MSETGFEIIEDTKEQQLFLDNRLNAADVVFVIYLLGERVKKLLCQNIDLLLIFQIRFLVPLMMSCLLMGIPFH